MRNLIRLEELAMFGLSIFMFNQLNYEWWWYLVFILTPDLCMIGYAAGPKVGGVLYNLGHHKAAAVLTWVIGLYFNIHALTFAGIILFGHSSMDRMFGYGLKYSDSFNHTHLGLIGHKTEN